MPYFLGFPEARVLDLLIMLVFYPVKFPSSGFEFLLDSCSAYCDSILTDSQDLNSDFRLPYEACDSSRSWYFPSLTFPQILFIFYVAFNFVLFSSFLLPVLLAPVSTRSLLQGIQLAQLAVLPWGPKWVHIVGPTKDKGK